MELKIIQDHPDYLIINKSPDLIVHGGPGIKEKTLVDLLVAKYPELKKVGEDPSRPAIVHRLDREASGLMIIPKNNQSFHYFKDQFQSRKIKKEYLALLSGALSSDTGTIDFPIKRSSQGFKMAALPKTVKNPTSNRDRGNLKARDQARTALTEFKVVKRFINFTLVRVQIITGRTHQIRVHFSALGHPLLGDNLYGNKKSRRQNEKIALKRIFLIADHLSFKDPQGRPQDVSLALSPELAEVLKKVK